MSHNNDLPKEFMECTADGDSCARQLYASYQELLQKPEAEALRDNPPKLYRIDGGSLGIMHNAGAGSLKKNEDIIVMGSMLTSWLTPIEQKAILAHELAHHILKATGLEETGFFARMNEKNERRADKLSATLMDYNVEPFISALAKIREQTTRLYQLLAKRMEREGIVDWDDKPANNTDAKPASGDFIAHGEFTIDDKDSKQPEQPPKPPVLTRIHDAIFAAIGTAAMQLRMLTDRSHPKDRSRAYYLRELAKEHAGKEFQADRTVGR